MDENLLNKIDRRFYHYSLVISILAGVCSFLCGFYLSEHFCHLESIKNYTHN